MATARRSGTGRRLASRRQHASISGDDRGERREPVELVVYAGPGNVGLRLLVDVDSNNTEQVLVEDRIRPEIDVEILGLQGKIMGDGIFKSATDRKACPAVVLRGGE